MEKSSLLAHVHLETNSNANVETNDETYHIQVHVGREHSLTPRLFMCVMRCDIEVKAINTTCICVVHVTMLSPRVFYMVHVLLMWTMRNNYHNNVCTYMYVRGYSP